MYITTVIHDTTMLYLSCFVVFDCLVSSMIYPACCLKLKVKVNLHGYCTVNKPQKMTAALFVQNGMDSLCLQPLSEDIPGHEDTKK